MKIAAIDAGTNSFHLLVARVAGDGSVETLESSKEMVRLGDSAFKGVISPEAFSKSVEAIRRFRTVAERGGCDAIVAVATSAVREAENGGDFVRVVRDETGIELTVIDGREEARLIYLGARGSLNLSARRALVVDIGGGSVELIVGDARQSHYFTSLKLGVLRLIEQWPLGDPVSLDQRSRLAEFLHRALEAPAETVRKIGFDLVALTSGTARAVADLAAPAGPTTPKPRQVRFQDVFALEDRLCATSAADRAKIPGLDAKRVDSIVPGCILVRSLLETLHVDDYVLCETALREGLVIDWVTRNRGGIQLVDEFPDPKRRSVIRLARRCGYDAAHASHVARLALDLFRGTRALHGLPNSDGELLEFAALLHDIGFHIASSKHHKHAAYLIESSDLQGFSIDEVRLLAQVVRYHRKATPQRSHEAYAALDEGLKTRVRVLAALLRVADGMDRGYGQVVKSARTVISDKVIEITVSAQVEPELELWAARRKADLFEEVFGRKAKFTVSKET
jgi:exopolyphosphatase/guanosine-5'-triphosphate,3'-diphosphate pyrophosphatase